MINSGTMVEVERQLSRFCRGLWTFGKSRSDKVSLVPSDHPECSHFLLPRPSLAGHWSNFAPTRLCCTLLAIATLLLLPHVSASSIANAQKRHTGRKAQSKPVPSTTEIEKLHDDYIKATKEYKASLEKLLPLYEKPQKTAEQKLAKSKELFSQGLISKRELENDERAVTEATATIDKVRKQITDADTQVANALVEIQTDKRIGRLPRGGFLKSTSLIRYNGAGPWALSQVGKIDTFFRQKFGRPLPIAVFGQGAIHNQWHLDHRNAMDVSVNPNGPEAQVLMDFLRANGIPFSAFRSAIPGVATGPHIHIGLPSHRY